MRSGLFICVAILSLVVSSCSASSSQAYPTYDPFAPVGATGMAPLIQDGGIVQDTPRGGPTPTRAPLSVTLPPRGSSIGLTTPTPDPPHLLPPPRDYVDQYTVQAGDTLGDIARRYGITLEALMQANGLNEASILSIGLVLNIPPIVTDPEPGSSFKIIPDSELIYGPASVDFDVEAFLKEKGGYLANYAEEVNGEYLTGTQIIQRV
ncbi:MAG: LysM peptidoglycan-binding domain-containing protein, partial [Anaerolineales bacterium]|nr:LysM peptidoglycan-binding domain-containing protein [Anaerolineales bacterium]